MEKLYEENPFLARFTAQVRSCAQGRRGWDVILDQTAFYPEGGGQPYDLGVLGGVQVLEVHEREGHVVHTCSAPLEVGSAVEGQIDWARRFDLMQHHSGEHIVSGLAHAMYGCDNMGFHMGADVITIDLNVELPQDQVRALEEAANRYIWEDHPVQITCPSQEELAHLEMVSAIVYQLTKGLSADEIRRQGFDTYFVDHTTGIYPQAASGVPFSAETLQSTGDPIADLNEDLAAEQKARVTYDNILRLADDPDVRDAIKFLREREIVHYQRFGEALRHTTEGLDSKNFYAFNPAFDTNRKKSR